MNLEIALAIATGAIVVLGLVTLSLHRRLVVIEDDFEEPASPANVNFVETIGPGGRIVLFADDDIDAKMLVLKDLRREVWRLAIESEIASHRRDLEVPAEESTS